MTGEPMHTASKVLCIPVCQLLSEKRSSYYASLPAVFNLLYSSTNQQLFEKNLCNQSNYYENYRRFSVMNGSHYVSTTKLTLFTVSKD